MVIKIQEDFAEDEKSKKIILQIIINSVWRFRNKPINEMNLERVYAKIKKIGNFGKYVENSDFVVDMSPEFHSEIYSETKEKFVRYVKRNIINPKKRIFYYGIGNFENISSEMQIGNCKVLTFYELPKKAQEFLKKRTMIETDYAPELAETKEELVKRRKKYVYLKLEINCLSQIKSEIYSHDFVNQDLHLLRYLFDKDFGSLEAILLENKEYYLGYSIGDWITSEETLSSGMKKQLLDFNDIINSANPSDLDARIKKAIELYGISIQIQYYDVQLLMLCSALEVLLLHERGNIGYKLAERIAFLIKTKKRRSDVFSDIIEIYKKRSAYAHQGTFHISETDVPNE